MTEIERKEALRAGLLGETHQLDYRTSAYFRAAIDSLVSMLPMWVEDIAGWAAHNDRQFQERVEAAKIASPDIDAVLKDLRLPPGSIRYTGLRGGSAEAT